jgi:hypothetical protein
VTDKQGRTSAGPGGQRQGAGVSASERVVAALTSGAGSTVAPDLVFKPNQIYLNGFKFAPKL